MYPDFYYVFKDLFNVELPFLKVIKTAGVFVALAFIAASWFWEKELRRLQAEGFLTFRERTVGREKKVVREWPGDWTPRVTILSALFAMAGAKFFALLENPSAFLNDPIGMLLSSNGFAFYGGLTAAFIAMWIYHRQWGNERVRIVDALVPALMIGYALGRIGCQVSGDGDWGINNPHPNPVSWMPDWLWAYDYPHNILRQGIYIQGCDWGDYCYHLPVPVYPAPLYEFTGALLLFAVLWMVRKRIKVAGRLTGLYMILMGAGRFFIEKLRVNTEYYMWDMAFTQAEFISVFMVVMGIALYIIAPLLNVNKSRLYNEYSNKSNV